MKKIMLVFATILVPFTLLIMNDIINLKAFNITDPQNNNFKQTDLIMKNNSATMDQYGPDPKLVTQPYRYRLNITMTEFYYDYFLAMMKNQHVRRQNFISAFTGYQYTYIDENWKYMQQQIRSAFTHASDINHLYDQYFLNLFNKWLMSKTGWNSFFNVYTGANLKNNTYFMPAGYDTLTAQTSFRQEGAILQFDFEHVQTRYSNIWKVDNICRIFPYQSDTVALKYYYQDNDQSWGVELKVPPLLPIVNSSRKTLKVQNLLPTINQAICNCFNLPNNVKSAKLISILQGQYEKDLSKSAQTPTTIEITFLDLNQKAYINKNIKIYQHY